MKADVANLQLEAGAEYEVNLVFSDAAGEAVSLAEARLEAYLKPSGGEAMELSISVPADESGLATVALPGQEIGMGAWEVWLTLSEGAAREQVIRGLVTVAASVNARAEGNPATHRLLVRLGDQVSATLESVDLAWWAWDKCKKAAAGVIDALARLSFKVGTVLTGAEGSEAQASLRQTAAGEYVLDLTIPRGDKGETGEVPVNVVTTNTAQTISGAKTFSGKATFNEMIAANGGVRISSAFALTSQTGYVELLAPSGGITITAGVGDVYISGGNLRKSDTASIVSTSVLNVTENDARYAKKSEVAAPSNMVTTDGTQTITGSKNFCGAVVFYTDALHKHYCTQNPPESAILNMGENDCRYVLKSQAGGGSSGGASSLIAAEYSGGAPPQLCGCAALAVGYNTMAKEQAVVVGINTGATSYGTGVGYAAYSCSYAVAVGACSTANPSSVAVGYYADSEPNGVAVGYEAVACTGAVAIGYCAHAADGSINIASGGYCAYLGVHKIGFNAGEFCLEYTDSDGVKHYYRVKQEAFTLE